MNVQTEFAPPGSSLYYSVLHCDEDLRKKIIALRGFYQAVQKIFYKIQDPSLVQIKFQWWHDELERLKNQSAQHPAMKILQDDFHHHAELETILHTFTEDTKISLYENENDLDKFYLNTAGLLEKILAEIQGIKTQTTENLGIFIQKVSDLKELRQAVLRGKIYLSGEQLLRHRVNLYELSQLKLTPPIYDLFKNHASNLHELRDKTMPCLCSRSTSILANIHNALLNEIEHAGFPILTQSISLTPLRQWWIAWKTK